MQPRGKTLFFYCQRLPKLQDNIMPGDVPPPVNTLHAATISKDEPTDAAQRQASGQCVVPYDILSPHAFDHTSQRIYSDAMASLYLSLLRNLSVHNLHKGPREINFTLR